MRMIHANAKTSEVLTDRWLLTYRVSELAWSATEMARWSGRPAIYVSDGGGVASPYRYPAQTEGVVAVALDGDTVVMFADWFPANKITCAGVVAGAVGERARPLKDYRFSKEKKDEARAYVLDEARAVIASESV